MPARHLNLPHQQPLNPRHRSLTDGVRTAISSETRPLRLVNNTRRYREALCGRGKKRNTWIDARNLRDNGPRRKAERKGQTRGAGRETGSQGTPRSAA
ncbi:hypothetical protein BOTNAR_0265g00020 [Botryotinia narcissicola]|uniref:Uncharacterized protein n=1 Tax=Botryotinia narcissicola TaxID=278944 RepID=A0A4Z1I6R6_9HELO|nr:hypothetical protein BOTNAR_0265g00020 [Botryotinia narcissicola]